MPDKLIDDLMQYNCNRFLERHGEQASKDLHTFLINAVECMDCFSKDLFEAKLKTLWLNDEFWEMKK